MANNMQVKMGTLENPQGGNAAGIIVQAATQKQGPTNKQLTVTLDAIRESVHNHKVTGQYAQRAQKDLEAVILHSKQLLEEKNSNDILQQLFLHIHQANMEARAKAKAEAAAKPPKTAGKDSKSKKDDKTSKAADKTKQKDQKGKDKNKGKAEEVSGKASKDGKKTVGATRPVVLAPDESGNEFAELVVRMRTRARTHRNPHVKALTHIPARTNANARADRTHTRAHALTNARTHTHTHALTRTR
eukprot:TRINITY_DN5000_c0_g1_i4.p2 TRINITY_DN5000_c0_g1~~TRINITY_DN5000_c0_g1_i4.p2  ORF type:complete len:245 (-),score=41.90 TRINITY_DN5000_c0_g1_i4:333-1067(-)